MSKKILITTEEIRNLLNLSSPEFDKYVSSLINLANRFSQATRPNVVGQMSLLIKEFGKGTFSDWEKWYETKMPDAIKNATDKIFDKLNDFKVALDKIDYQIVENWVRDLVISKSYIGLRFQEIILMKIAELRNSHFTLAQPEEEARGIDGFIDNIPISIKPASYKVENNLVENIDAIIIFYNKTQKGIEFEIPDKLLL
ncbi:MAG: MjaI family restriction endonuclease [Ignavibacteria bacterium]|nr:MjaI family restriction endonuclease [Ignavibacteria bacterium]